MIMAVLYQMHLLLLFILLVFLSSRHSHLIFVVKMFFYRKAWVL